MDLECSNFKKQLSTFTVEPSSEKRGLEASANNVSTLFSLHSPNRLIRFKTVCFWSISVTVQHIRDSPHRLIRFKTVCYWSISVTVEHIRGSNKISKKQNFKICISNPMLWVLIGIVLKRRF